VQPWGDEKARPSMNLRTGRPSETTCATRRGLSSVPQRILIFGGRALCAAVVSSACGESLRIILRKARPLASMLSDAQRENTRGVLKQLLALWDERSVLYGDVFFGSAIVQGLDEKWRNATTFLLPMHKSEVRSTGLEDDYGDFKMVDGGLSLDEARSVLTEVVERDRLRLPSVPEIPIEASLHAHSRRFQHSGPNVFPIFYPYYETNFSVEQDFKGDCNRDCSRRPG
jgi:hypothetical protein